MRRFPGDVLWTRHPAWPIGGGWVTCRIDGPKDWIEPSRKAGMDSTIFATSDFLLRHMKAGDLRVCIVCFSSFTDEPRLDRPGFGEAFFRDRGIDAIHAINRTNVWYQYPEIPEALAAVRSITKRYDKVFTYGSSMGGYAAIRFAEAVGAKTAIAISPQYSASPGVIPFDKRWLSITRDIDFFLEARFGGGSAMIKPLVFYDPSDADAKHFELISKAYPLARGVRLRHAGHPAGGYLSEAGILKDAIGGIIDGVFDASDFERSARALRRSSGQYFFTLARRLPRWRYNTKMRLAETAVEQREDAAYLIYLSMLLEKQGDLEAAERRLRRSIEVLPDHPVPMRAICVFLSRRGRFSEAIAFGEKMIAIDSLRPDYARLLLVGMFGAGRLGEISRVIGLAALAAGRRGAPFVRLLGYGLGVLAAMGVEIKVFTALRPLVLAWFRRQHDLDAELDLFDEWRCRRPRRWKIWPGANSLIDAERAPVGR